ncbi:MAG: TolC family protein [Steroidobacteraceae bacterium]
MERRPCGRGLAALALLLSPLLAWPSPAGAATRSLAEVVDEYVRAGLESNLALRSQGFDVERALAGLDGARAGFFPSLALTGRYTRNEGGREFVLPLSRIDPALADETLSFLRERDQDTRLGLTQPLYAPAIPASLRAQRSQLAASEYARLALARRLRRDITVGYLDWSSATKTVAIVAASRTLLTENLRVNEALFRNGKLTQDQVLRARAELLAVEQQLRESANLAQQARRYLNFLMNRPLESELEATDVEHVAAQAAADLATLEASALADRPELAEADSAANAADAQVDAARAALKPTLALGVDAGIQGEDYATGHGYNYGQVSLQLSWKLFDGGASRAAVRAARALARRAATQRDELALQVQLEVRQAFDRLATAVDSLATADARAQAARAGFRIASRKRDEGMISQVEFIDARSTLTSAELNLNLTRFALLTRQAELDYVTASGTLPVDPLAPGSTP